MPDIDQTVPVASRPKNGVSRVIRNPRVDVIDVFRFIAALWVMLGHLGPFPLVQGLSKNNLTGLIVRGIYNNLFAGPPAVIVFFVISGYCIHRPFRGVAKLPLANYFSRRYVRILFPMAVAVLLAKPVGFPLPLFNNSILWSLLAELIYYSIYPVLRPLATRFGWKRLIAIAYVASLFVAFTKPRSPDYAAYGIYLNWLLGLACWLLGCLLAERGPVGSPVDVRLAEIWVWRALIWGLGTICSILNFHSPIVYPWTLNIFAFAVFFWLGKEIRFHRHRSTSKLLAWAGLWTYSLYLTHRIVMAGWEGLAPALQGTRMNWLLQVALMLVCAYLFYLIVERPGHILARVIARSVDSRVVIKQERV